MKKLITLIVLVGAGFFAGNWFGRKGGYEQGTRDTWHVAALNYSRLREMKCPEGVPCTVWSLAAPVKYSEGTCISSPNPIEKQPGRLLAVDPHDAHIVAVAFDGTCHSGVK
jgi:hypothetical protein